MFTAPLLAVQRSRRLRLAGQLDAAEHALPPRPPTTGCPAGCVSRCSPRDSARPGAQGPRRATAVDDLPDTAPRSAMLRGTTEAVTVLDLALRAAERDGIALMRDRPDSCRATEP
jgi:hypothetical protein